MFIEMIRCLRPFAAARTTIAQAPWRKAMARCIVSLGIILLSSGQVEASRLEGWHAVPSLRSALVSAADSGADFAAKLDEAQRQCCQIGCRVTKQGVTRFDLCPI
jgi:hypothetical protein